MRYTNPVVKGFYPDPSVCFDEITGKYYMVCSSFQYFPGVPLFESDDLVNWEPIGYVLSKKSQVALADVESSGGVFAPTIRCHDGRFYMVTTNNTTRKHFYVCTDDIHGQWSEPVTVDQDGIDPSLMFDGGKTYFISTGTDDNGINGITQCEIDIATGKKLTGSRNIWCGSGGRYPESPHMYKIGDWYYLMIAEGGTEYGHMITCARARSPWGKFESCPRNPILTNRNKAPGIIQGIGHGDLVFDKNGGLHIICLGFRQIDIWLAYHNLGREVFLVPAGIDESGWLYAGSGGVCEESYELTGDFPQREKKLYTIDNASAEWRYLRHPDFENYSVGNGKAVLRGSSKTLNDAASPTFIGLCQREFCFEMSAELSIDGGEAGLTAYMCESEHYEVALRKIESGFEAICRLNIGGIKHIMNSAEICENKAKLIIRGDNFSYSFFVSQGGREICLGTGQTKYLSSEVSGGFTGVILAMYATGGNKAEFSGFELKYS